MITNKIKNIFYKIRDDIKYYKCPDYKFYKQIKKQKFYYKKSLEALKKYNEAHVGKTYFYGLVHILGEVYRAMNHDECWKDFEFKKKDIIATDCKIVKEDKNGIHVQMKINNNYDDYERGKTDWLYFLAMVSLAITGIVIILLLI